MASKSDLIVSLQDQLHETKHRLSCSLSLLSECGNELRTLEHRVSALSYMLFESESFWRTQMAEHCAFLSSALVSAVSECLPRSSSPRALEPVVSSLPRQSMCNMRWEQRRGMLTPPLPKSTCSTQTEEGLESILNESDVVMQQQDENMQTDANQELLTSLNISVPLYEMFTTAALDLHAQSYDILQSCRTFLSQELSRVTVQKADQRLERFRLNQRQSELVKNSRAMTVSAQSFCDVIENSTQLMIEHCCSIQEVFTACSNVHFDVAHRAGHDVDQWLDSRISFIEDLLFPRSPSLPPATPSALERLLLSPGG